MTTTVERELKLEAPETFSLARLGARLNSYVTSAVELHRLHTVYYDTDDYRLARWGCSLRFRHDEGWTLKLPAGRATRGLARAEHVFEGGPQTVPAGALDLATAYLRGTMPHPVAELRTLRTKRHVFADDGTDLAEVVEDDVRVVDGSRVVERFRELEIELMRGAADETLDRLAALLRAEGAGPPDPTPKNVRALGDRARDPEIAAPSIGPKASAGDLVRAVLASSVERLVRIDAAIRLNPDPEAVHDARVAVRRLRSDLRTFVPVLDRDWACELRNRMRWLGDGLSAARDADVMLTRLERRTLELPESDRRRSDELLDRFRAGRDEAYERVRAMLHEERYVELLRDIVDAAKRPTLNPCAADAASDVIPALMADAWAALRRAVRERGRPPSDRELHRIRIKAKRVRYAAEAITPVIGQPARRFAKRVERLQTVLGDHHDAVVAGLRLRSEGERSGAGFLAGELVVLEYQSACDARTAWGNVWREAAKKRYRFWRAS